MRINNLLVLIKQTISKLASFMPLGLKNIVFGKFPRRHRIWAFLILGLLTFTLSTYWTPLALGQAPMEQIAEKLNTLPIAPSSDNVSSPEIQKPPESPAIVSNTIGDIVYAPVKLDGYKLFDVASQVVLHEDQSSGQEASPIAKRVESIENALKTIIELGDRPTLEIKVVTLHGQTTLVASDQKVLHNKVIGTVTDLDAQLYGISVPHLAKEAAQRIDRALRRAWYEREPEYLRRQILVAIQIAIAMLVASGILIYMQKYLKAKWRTRQERVQENFRPDRSLISRWTTLRQTTKRRLRRLGTENTTNPDSNQPGEYATHCDQLLSNQQQQSRWQHLRDRNFLLRRILAFGEIAIWLFGIASILRLFPYTRELGGLLMGKPIFILAIWLILILCQKASELFIDFSLTKWAEDKSLTKGISQRNSLRGSTLAITVKRTIASAFLVLGIYLSLQALNIPIGALIAGAGIVGLALSFAFQDLIKDLINGFRIVWIDSFAVGDIIAIGDVSGLVEDLTLLYTQLRDLEGRLITIPNSEIRIVQNMTKDWSRVDFTVEVGYEADADRALEIIQKVAEQMYTEPEWQKLIIEPPELLGIEQLSYSGLLIRLWIKTQPLQQWTVGREFRRRLKRAFDREGIPIGMPQQSLSLKNHANGNGQSLIVSRDFSVNREESQEKDAERC